MLLLIIVAELPVFSISIFVNCLLLFSEISHAFFNQFSIKSIRAIWREEIVSSSPRFLFILYLPENFAIKLNVFKPISATTWEIGSEDFTIHILNLLNTDIKVIDFFLFLFILILLADSEETSNGTGYLSDLVRAFEMEFYLCRKFRFVICNFEWFSLIHDSITNQKPRNL